MFSAKIYFLRHVVAETLVLRRDQVVIEYKEVCVLAGLDGTLCGFDAELLCSVNRIAQQHKTTNYLLSIIYNSTSFQNRKQQNLTPLCPLDNLKSI